jgi:hypothetical protein
LLIALKDALNMISLKTSIECISDN